MHASQGYYYDEEEEKTRQFQDEKDEQHTYIQYMKYKIHEIYNKVPLYPLPLVTPITSIISSDANTLLIGTGFSRCSRAHCTLSSIVPPFNWISIM